MSNRLLGSILVLAATTAAQQFTLYQDRLYGPNARHKLDLYVPINSPGPTPLVIYIHGGGWQGGSYRPEPTFVTRLCARGYAVASVEYRLVTASTSTWPTQIHDCRAAVRWLRANAADPRYHLDPDRFAVFGTSAGGHLAAMVGTTGEVDRVRIGSETVEIEGTVGPHLTTSSRVSAVVDWYGPTTFLRVRDFPSPFYPGVFRDDPQSIESKLIGGRIQLFPELCASADPGYHASPDDPPILIMHGTADLTVPFNQSELLASQFAFGTMQHVQLEPIANAGHAPFTSAAHERIVDRFLDDNLRDLPNVTVGVVASDPLAAEAGLDPGAFTISRTGATTAPLSVPVHLHGDATNGVDYEPIGMVVVISIGSSGATVQLRPRDDGLAEGSEAVVLTIRPDRTFRIDAARNRASVLIADDEPTSGLPIVALVATDRVAGELSDPGQFTLTRTGATGSTLIVALRVSGTALPRDLQPIPGSATFLPGSATTTVTVTPVDDQDRESTETVILTLQAGHYVLGADRTASVAILDDDTVAVEPTIAVVVSDVNLREGPADAGEFVITRTELGGIAAPLAVPFSLGGTARAGVDYVAPGSPITIPANASRVVVPILARSDGLVEGDESVTLTLIAPPNCKLAFQATAEITLVDEDAPAPAGVQLQVEPLRPGGSLLATISDGGVGDAYVLFVALGPSWFSLPSIGAIGIDINSAVAVGSGSLDGGGVATVFLPVPVGMVLGTPVWMQGVTLRATPFSGRVSNVVVRRVGAR